MHILYQHQTLILSRKHKKRCQIVKNRIDFPCMKAWLVLDRIYELIRRRRWRIVSFPRKSNRSCFSRLRNLIHPPRVPVLVGVGSKEGNRAARKQETKKKKKKKTKKTRKKRKGIGWKVQPGFLEGNASVNDALVHKSSTVNRKTGWAVNRKHVAPPKPHATSIDITISRQRAPPANLSFRLCSELCSESDVYNVHVLAPITIFAQQFAFVCPQSFWEQLFIRSWRCFVVIFLLFFFFFFSFVGFLFT